MPCRHKCHRNAGTDVDPVFPIVGFSGDGGVAIAHDRVVAERGDDAGAVIGRKPRQRGNVEMIVMAVRYQNDIDRRQIGKCDARIVYALWPDKAKR